MILVITGNGKGKTTSAIGTAIRGLGWGKTVAMVFFDKGGSHYGEQNIFDFLQDQKKGKMQNLKLKNQNSKFKIQNPEFKTQNSKSEIQNPKFKMGQLDVFRFGQVRFDEAKQKFRFENEPGDFEEAQRAIQKAHELLSGNHDLILCDEIINTMNGGLIPEADVQKLVDNCPKKCHLILTGRNAPDWLIEQADLVSDIREVKHYYNKVKQAVKGVDY